MTVNNRWLRWLEYVCLAIAVFGMIIASTTQQIGYIAIPLASLLSFNFVYRQRLNRRIQVIKTDTQQLEHHIGQRFQAWQREWSQQLPTSSWANQLREFQKIHQETRQVITQMRAELREYQSKLDSILIQVNIFLKQQENRQELEETDLPESILRFKRDIINRLVDLEAFNSDFFETMQHDKDNHTDANLE